MSKIVLKENCDLKVFQNEVSQKMGQKVSKEKFPKKKCQNNCPQKMS